VATGGSQSSFNFGALEERVTGLEKGMAQIAASVDALAHDVRERQRFPWAAIFGGVSVLLVMIGMIGGVVVWSFNGYLATVNEAMNRQQAQLQSIVQSIVPRGEHEGHWNNEAAAEANLQRQIDQMRAEFGSTYSLNDTLKTIVQRVERLEQLRLDQSKTAN